MASANKFWIGNYFGFERKIVQTRESSLKDSYIVLHSTKPNMESGTINMIEGYQTLITGFFDSLKILRYTLLC